MTAKSFLSSGALLILSVVFFSFAHPGVVFVRGLFLFGWLSYAPVFLLLRRCTVRSAGAWGAAYGLLRFAAMMFWLFRYSLGGLAGVCLAMAVETGVMWTLCVWTREKLCAWEKKSALWGGLVAKNAWIFPPVLFLLFDWLRTLGDLGFSYGIIGYSQWQIAPFVRSARVFGVWGVSFVIMLFGALMAEFLADYTDYADKGHLSTDDTDYADKGAFSENIKICVYLRYLRENFSRNTPKCLLFALCFFVILITGLVPQKSVGTQSLSVALVQPNSDPWKNGVVAYREELRALIVLTDKALSEQPDTQLVVWSETAFVPDIVRHYTERADAERFALVAELLSYIESKNCAFVLGNNHAERSADGAVHTYNSALYFEPHTNVFPPGPAVYSKMRLVPFSEHVPYPFVFAPFAHLFDPDPHYWDKGAAATLFKTNGIQFCTPICFEDTFSPHIKAMCASGAQLIVNLSNDSWAHSLVCQNQHLAMAVFRSAENGVPTIRSTASGVTCIIDAQGKVVSELEPFVSGYLCGTVAVKNETQMNTDKHR